MRSVLVVLAVSLALFFCVGPVAAHDCNGLIINSSNVTFTLVSSVPTHGIVDVQPTVELTSYSSTSFSLESNFGANDRILYTWSYTPEVDWCGDGSKLTLSGQYQYSYGTNSCTGSKVTCASTGAVMTVSYAGCDGRYGTSSPSFSIAFQ
eukprot:TRINITY_DN1271_c0_g1_i1.p2 TRINITY_DN1271_c0_g1~~TRINITY_DN1271_c0_g1_i1.p2  ORF type:complete len:160 (-),score=66.03 TRINITY_DN1271_c0_g1_i1:69-518(-)